MRVSLNNIKFKYPKEEVLFKDFNLSIQKNQITCLLGPNGSGKSTILKLILGAVTKAKGSILFNDKTINNTSKKSHLIATLLVFLQGMRWRRKFWRGAGSSSPTTR